MKRPALIMFIISLCFILFSCSKEDNKALAEKEFKISADASLNQELKKLEGNIKTAQTDVERADIYTKIAVINAEKGDVNSLIKSAAEAIKYQPNQYMSHYLLGKSYITAGRLNDAVTELEIAIGLKSDFAPAYFEMGNALYKKFSYPGAKDNYKKAVKLDKNLIDAYNNLGVISTITGDLGEAEKNLRQCISIDPGYAKAYKNLGILYDTKMKKPAEAITNYNKYLSLRPDCPERGLVKLWISALGG